jgi:hypothetical protein
MEMTLGFASKIVGRLAQPAWRLGQTPYRALVNDAIILYVISSLSRDRVKGDFCSKQFLTKHHWRGSPGETLLILSAFEFEPGFLIRIYLMIKN